MLAWLGYAIFLLALLLVGTALVFVWRKQAKLGRELVEAKLSLGHEYVRGHTEGMERMLGELDERVKTETEKRMLEWKLHEEPKTRKNAIKQSIAVVKGKVAEQLVPFSSEWPFNPRDARFLGSPIDFIVFQGMTEGKLERIVFVEVKSGKWGGLTERQKQVQDRCEFGYVEFLTVHVKPKGGS